MFALRQRQICIRDSYFFVLCPAPNTCPTQTLSFPLNLPGLAAGSHAAGLHVVMRGAWGNPFVAPDHLVTFYLNGALLGDVSWDEYELSNTTLSFDQSLLQATNTLTATITVIGGGTQDQVYPDWFELNYYDVPQARSNVCLLYTSPSPRDRTRSRMPSSA